jgi:ABC-type phosphate transport system substrate-binding protein
LLFTTTAPYHFTHCRIAIGSGGVSDTLTATVWSIGYVDSGHGHTLNLQEVAVKNAAGVYLKSIDADIAGAVSQVLDLLPSASGDWADPNLSLINLGGSNTWPIVAFSYLFIRQDLTHFGRNGPLIKAFAETVLSAEGQVWLSLLFGSPFRFLFLLFSCFPTAMLSDFGFSLSFFFSFFTLFTSL